MKVRIFKFLRLTVAVATLCLGGCSGDDKSVGSGTTASGVFKDSNVSGLTYLSGNQTGVTGLNGGFTYEVGNTVTFSIGGVTIGTATGQSVVTPVDLVAGGSTNSTQVQNIVRFLLMLDLDGDPTNDITISTAVQNVAGTWSQVNFSAVDLATELASIISDANTADGVIHVLPEPAMAQAHLESTFLCTHAGAFRGTFTGDDTGPFGVLVDVSTGYLIGFAYSIAEQELLSLSGSASISFDQNATFISGDASTGATFSGQFTGTDQVGGTWENLQFSEMGSFSGNRIGGAANAAYRFTGTFTGGAFGLFTFDVDVSDNIQGVAYTVYAPVDGTTDELISFSGTLSGNTLSATITDPTGAVEATITGTLDKSAGVLSGNWSDIDGNSGTFSGSGCKLN